MHLFDQSETIKLTEYTLLNSTYGKAESIYLIKKGANKVFKKKQDELFILSIGFEGDIVIADGRSRVPECRVEQGHVWKWLNNCKAPVPPAEYVLAIAAATDWKYRPHDLRPDLYPNPTDALPPTVSAARLARAA